MFNFFKKKPLIGSKKKPLIGSKLIGSELIDKVKEIGDVSKTDLAIACGYYRVVDGARHVCFAEFYTALLDSKGIELGPYRKLSYIATVLGNGNLLIGTAYTAMMDLQPGDQFEIKLGKNDITLTRMGPLEDPWFH